MSNEKVSENLRKETIESDISAYIEPKNGSRVLAGYADALVATPPKPKISVVIPTYMEEKIIASTLENFTPELKAKYNLEIVVSDGGSSDRTVEIASYYADKIVEHDSPRRQNISEGRNRGAEAASGDVFVFMNADSIPGDVDAFFESVTAWDEGCAYCGCDALACYICGAPSETALKDKLFYRLHNFYVQALNFIGVGMGRGECQIVRRAAFESVGGYNNEIAAGEDFDFYRRLGGEWKIGFARNLVIYESTRRFKKQGYFKTLALWTINALSVWFLGRSISKEWEAVR